MVLIRPERRGTGGRGEEDLACRNVTFMSIGDRSGGGRKGSLCRVRGKLPHPGDEVQGGRKTTLKFCLQADQVGPWEGEGKLKRREGGRFLRERDRLRKWLKAASGEGNKGRRRLAERNLLIRLPMVTETEEK